METRKFALELAARHLSSEPHNLATVLYWASEFNKFIVGAPAADEKTAPVGYDEDMVSKTKLKESVQHLREYYRNRQKVVTAAHLAGYDEAIKDVLRVIDLL